LALILIIIEMSFAFSTLSSGTHSIIFLPHDHNKYMLGDQVCKIGIYHWSDFKLNHTNKSNSLKFHATPSLKLSNNKGHELIKFKKNMPMTFGIRCNPVKPRDNYHPHPKSWNNCEVTCNPCFI
jgi:hypothetical protein